MVQPLLRRRDQGGLLSFRGNGALPTGMPQLAILSGIALPHRTERSSRRRRMNRQDEAKSLVCLRRF